jgi:hypothetical protein
MQVQSFIALFMGVFGWLQADTVAAVWTAAAAIHREKNTVEAAAAAGLQPQQAAANKLIGLSIFGISIKPSCFPPTNITIYNAFVPISRYVFCCLTCTADHLYLIYKLAFLNHKTDATFVLFTRLDVG